MVFINDDRCGVTHALLTPRVCMYQFQPSLAIPFQTDLEAFLNALRDTHWPQVIASTNPMFTATMSTAGYAAMLDLVATELLSSSGAPDSLQDRALHQVRVL